MSGYRLVGTSAAMGGIAVVLALLTPPLPEMSGTVLAAQDTADTVGAEVLLLAAAGLVAWGVWAWGCLGLLLTAASVLPGALGSAAHRLAGAVLPEGARRAAALALGLGLGLAGPLAGTALLLAPTPAAAAGPIPALPDWPVTTDVPPGPARSTTPDIPGALPDWPDAPALPAPGEHVVVRGDCLWDIAAAELSARLGRSPTGAEVAVATHAWWVANAGVVGPDPDLLLPGQVLHPPPR